MVVTCVLIASQVIIQLVQLDHVYHVMEDILQVIQGLQCVIFVQLVLFQQVLHLPVKIVLVEHLVQLVEVHHVQLVKLVNFQVLVQQLVIIV